MLNDPKIITGLKRSGDYKISRDFWEKTPTIIDGKQVEVKFEHWNP